MILTLIADNGHAALSASPFMPTSARQPKHSAPTDEITTIATAPIATAEFSLWWFAFAVLVALVYLGTTGALPLVGRDEPRYVQIGRNMLESGDWITPRLGGFHWFEKPVALYWMVASSFAIFGFNEWAARLGPALCGLGCAALLWWMVRPFRSSAARWCALVTASSGGLLAFSHGATFDIVLTFALTLALCAWWRAQTATDEKSARRFLALFWAGVGLAFLSKGLIAFVLPALTLLFYAGLCALTRQKLGRLKVGFWWGLPLALLVSAVWYGPVLWANGMEWVNVFFVQHHFARFTSDKFRHHQPIWFYGEILPLLLLPWTPFWLLAIWNTRRDLRADASRARLLLFAWAWTLAPLAFFSLSGSKLPGYILPALPGACLVTGLWVHEWAHNPARRRFAGALAALVLVGTAILTLSPFGVERAERDSVRALFVAAHERGLDGVRVANFRTVSRPAEFYAARALLYGQDGEPLKLQTSAQIAFLTRNEPLLLLLSPAKRASLESRQLRVEEIAGNSKTQLVLVSRARN